MSGAEVTPRCVVAGHICLDIIPQLEARYENGFRLTPGQLLNVGPAMLATGGVVSNTGLALHRLGAPVRLMGKVGDDLLGRAILDALRTQHPELARDMIIAPGESSSYTLVINPPGVDRMFLHHPGANDTFSSGDVPDAALDDAALFHFGYPPLMKRIFQNDGAELETLLRRVKSKNLSTSLDMTVPDPDSAAGQIDWPALLKRVLLFVDVFLPSLDELLFMLRHGQQAGAQPDWELLRAISQALLQMGVAVVVIKLGEHGLYARVTDDAARLRAMGICAPLDAAEWIGQEAWAPPFEVEVAGTTGAGDSAIAGFLFGLLSGFDLKESLVAASATAACCCERPDATSGLRSWLEIDTRLAKGWAKRVV